MSVTSLTSHNIVFPQERTIQVEETQNCFNKDEAKSFDRISSISTFFCSTKTVTDNVLIFGFPRLLLQKQGFVGDGITRVLPNIYRTDQRYVLMSYSILWHTSILHQNILKSMALNIRHNMWWSASQMHPLRDQSVASIQSNSQVWQLATLNIAQKIRIRYTITFWAILFWSLPADANEINVHL